MKIVVVTGRMGVGKSFLLQRACAGSSDVEYFDWSASKNTLSITNQTTLVCDHLDISMIDNVANIEDFGKSSNLSAIVFICQNADTHLQSKADVLIDVAGNIGDRSICVEANGITHIIHEAAFTMKGLESLYG